MSGVAAVLKVDDPRWNKRSLVELVSSSFDPDKAGVGSSPYVGDMASTGVVVPTAPTTSQSNRYLIRLCGIQIPAGKAIILHGLRQAVTIRELVSPECGQFVPFELDVRSPFWSFVDGNVSWHLRLQGLRVSPAVFDASQVPGTDPNLNRLDAALLYRPPLSPYVAPNAGIPPGQPVPWLDTWRDLRYPWDNTDWKLNMLLTGPHNIVYYASVHQTDPDNRACAQVPDVGAPGAEDRFIQQFRRAVYHRVAGGMLVETLPLGRLA